jgi:hypothetical protein
MLGRLITVSSALRGMLMVCLSSRDPIRPGPPGRSAMPTRLTSITRRGQ